MTSSQLVVCVGDALVDLIATVERLPARGGAVWSPPLRRLAGEGELRALGLSPAAGQLYAVKRGERGARLQGPQGSYADAPAHPTQAVDATGAGDAFDAAFIAAHLRGYPDERALRFANAAAALSVTQPGARAMPSWAAADQLASTGRPAR